ncbi:hypothetical protein [Alkalihalophilus marmarensis]|uniref:Uncharacterized protein n=1 Tax=Alkalihalophilus marmarensis DSM 21297 TaxID=1188261 RepID=U6SSN1_9BACI|nr:hypothetical protein [Alkalihalophilus marmarensis]ERN53900.1 hypothetical protein A33I_09520 [Alkalihalophilus marmarensis DSM 21297]
MFKQPLRYSIIYVLLFCSYQFLFRDEITWMMNIFTGIWMFLFLHFIKWCMVPYDWNKKKQ